jgi:hypothetical protein
MSNDSIDFLVQSIEKSMVMTEKQFVYQKYYNFFDKPLLEKINSSFGDLEFEDLNRQIHLPRRKACGTNTLVKELTVMFRNVRVSEALGKKFGLDLVLSSVDLWVDNKGYHMPPHIDDQSIKLSLQVYLGKGEQPGTCLHFFSESDYFKKFEYSQNCGYALVNNENSFHSVEYPVVKDGRKSLYLRFG